MTSIYLHNSRCSKSRQGIEILNKAGVSFSIKEYLKEPLTKKLLGELYTLLSQNYSVKEFTRVKEKAFKQQNLNIENISSKEKWVNLIHQNPVLLERPILLNSKEAILGRPPENFLK